MYSPYGGAAEMLLPINGKLTIGKLKSLRLAYSFLRSRYEAHLELSVLSLIIPDEVKIISEFFFFFSFKGKTASTTRKKEFIYKSMYLQSFNKDEMPLL